MAFGSFSLCCYTCGKRVSVSLRPVYDIFQRVSGQIPLQIVHADMPDRVLHVRAAAEARACNMRREQHVLHVPQRTVRRKRFGLEHIECGAARLPRPTLTSTAPAFIACRRSAVSRPAVSRVFGRQPMTMSARGSRASNASSVCASSKSAGTAETAVRFTPSTAAPKTFNRRATFAPMSPMPSTSAVLPEIVSAWSYFCQICACLLLQYRPNERYSATRLPRTPR